MSLPPRHTTPPIHAQLVLPDRAGPESVSSVPLPGSAEISSAEVVRTSVPSNVDRRIGDLAARQYGVVSRRQLDGLGLSRSAVQARIRRGWLRPVHRGVYAVGHSELSDRGGWLAACLAGSNVVAGQTHEACLSHHSAAALHGLLPRDRGVPEITVTTARGARPGLRVHRTSSLGRSATTRDHIPCTTVARTIVDIAGTGNEAATQRTWSAAASRKAIRAADVEYELEVNGHRPGSALVRRLYDLDYRYLEQRTRSDLEQEALRLCRDFRLLMPFCNRLLWIGDTCFEADLLWPGPRLIVELDGDGVHSSSTARRADRSRDLSLQLAGWRTARIGWPEVTVFRADTADRLRMLIAQPPLPPTPGRTEATRIEAKSGEGDEGAGATIG